MKWKIWSKIRILREKKSKEFGTRQKRILFGKKIHKIKCRNKRKGKRLIINGKRRLNYPFHMSDKSKIKEKLVLPKKIGLKEENPDMDGNKRNKEDRDLPLGLRITRQKFFRRD